jgi:hypothetical protein
MNGIPIFNMEGPDALTKNFSLPITLNTQPLPQVSGTYPLFE